MVKPNLFIHIDDRWVYVKKSMSGYLKTLDDLYPLFMNVLHVWDGFWHTQNKRDHLVVLWFTKLASLKVWFTDQLIELEE